MRGKFSTIMYVLCGVIILFSLYTIGQRNYQNYKEEKKLKEALQEEQRKEEENNNIEKVEPVIEVTSEVVKEEIQEQRQILSQYKNRYEENKDFYGWIKTEDEHIDLPVMYTPQEGRENYYVYRNFDKEYSKSGSIYIDYRCKPESNNYLIYGHNMKDLSMFGYLSCYKEESFYKNHKYIKFDTIYEEGEYEIVAISSAFIKKEDLEDPSSSNNSKVPYKEVGEEDYLFYNHLLLNTKDEFNAYIQYMKDNSYYETQSTAEYGDKLITLCTCTNTKKWQNERLLIVAKKIK
ncbi:MAG: class B sortase [Clostridia bacterium]|nr:class B sortase [Clostridia bacterium]